MSRAPHSHIVQMQALQDGYLRCQWTPLRAGRGRARLAFQSDRRLTRLNAGRTYLAILARCQSATVRHGARAGGRPTRTEADWERGQAGAPAFRARGLPARPRGPVSWVRSVAHGEVSTEATSWSRPFLPRVGNDPAAAQ